MTPDTVHLLAQVLRYQRGLATSFGKWVEKQDDPIVALRDLREGIQMFRRVLDSCEQQLQRVDVDYQQQQTRKVS